MKVSACEFFIFKFFTMKKRMFVLSAIMLCFLTYCSKTGTQTLQRSSNQDPSTADLSQKQMNGSHSDIPAYYDSVLHTIHFSEFSATAETNLIAHNKSLNFIYQSDPGLPNGQPFISVIDAIPGDGFNPIWQEVQITFNAGFTPRQLYSDNAVLAAASGINPEIKLDTTNEVYWCPVVGTKN
jgi:hypothetical protein